jgi:hypothetical protein
MGISFKGLTSAALVSRNGRDASMTEKDVADVPASVAGHASMDAGHRPVDEKLGAPRSEVETDDDSLNKVDTTVEAGVRKAQAMTLVWTKKEIMFAYVK